MDLCGEGGEGMFVFHRKTALPIILSLLCVLLIGCGNTPQPVQESQTETQDSAMYEKWITAQSEEGGDIEIMEAMMPSSEDALAQEDVITFLVLRLFVEVGKIGV